MPAASATRGGDQRQGGFDRNDQRNAGFDREPGNPDVNHPRSYMSGNGDRDRAAANRGRAKHASGSHAPTAAAARPALRITRAADAGARSSSETTADSHEKEW